jgi:hypothetical protein
MEKYYTVDIKSAGHKLFFRGKKLRTPCRFEKVTEGELAYLKAIINKDSIQNYTLEDYKLKKAHIDKIEENDFDDFDEEPYADEPMSLIDKLAREE